MMMMAQPAEGRLQLRTVRALGNFFWIFGTLSTFWDCIGIFFVTIENCFRGLCVS